MKKSKGMQLGAILAALLLTGIIMAVTVANAQFFIVSNL